MWGRGLEGGRLTSCSWRRFTSPGWSSVFLSLVFWAWWNGAGKGFGLRERTRQIPLDVLPRLASQFVDLGLLMVSLVLRLVERAEADVGVALVRHVGQWYVLVFGIGGETGEDRKGGKWFFVGACFLRLYVIVPWWVKVWDPMCKKGPAVDVTFGIRHWALVIRNMNQSQQQG